MFIPQLKLLSLVTLQFPWPFVLRSQNCSGHILKNREQNQIDLDKTVALVLMLNFFVIKNEMGNA